jgi:hypothetical protein
LVLESRVEFPLLADGMEYGLFSSFQLAEPSDFVFDPAQIEFVESPGLFLPVPSEKGDRIPFIQ